MDGIGSRILNVLRERLGWLAGIVALAAWLALLWAMFGDVL